MTAKNSFKSYEGIVAFLIFEILALASFGLGGINVVFHFAGFLIAVFSFLTSGNQFKKGELTKLLTFLIPLFVFAILVSFGTSDYNYGKTLECIGTFLGILSFFFMGMTARRNESFNIEIALICIGGGLALLVLINMFATWFDYGPFYPLIYASKPDGYYRGEIIDLTKEMKSLVGLGFYETSISYGTQFAILLATSIPALFFIDHKKETRKFLIVASYAVIAIVSLATITSITSLVFVAIIIVVGVVYKFFRDNDLFKKLMKWALIVILSLAGLILLVVVLNNIGVSFVVDLLKGNSFLDRAFNTNHVIANINDVMAPAFKSFNLFGFSTNGIGDVSGTFDALNTSSGHFELEILKEGGIFALIALVVFGVFAFFATGRYLKKSSDGDVSKVVLLSFLIIFVLYYSVAHDSMPLLHVNGYRSSFSHGILFCVALFVVGYIANAKGIDPVEFAKKTKKEKQQVSGVSAVEEYDFSDSDMEEKR